MIERVSLMLPWKNSQPYGNRSSLQLSLRKTKTAPLHSKESCGPGIILQTSKDSDSKSRKSK